MKPAPFIHQPYGVLMDKGAGFLFTENVERGLQPGLCRLTERYPKT